MDLGSNDPRNLLGLPQKKEPSVSAVWISPNRFFLLGSVPTANYPVYIVLNLLPALCHKNAGFSGGLPHFPFRQHSQESTSLDKSRHGSSAPKPVEGATSACCQPPESQGAPFRLPHALPQGKDSTWQPHKVDPATLFSCEVWERKGDSSQTGFLGGAKLGFNLRFGLISSQLRSPSCGQSSALNNITPKCNGCLHLVSLLPRMTQ